MTVGDNIRRLRKEAGLTQEKLATMLDVSRSTVTQWERGWSHPRIDFIPHIAKVLQTTTADIIEGQDATSVEDYTPDPSASGNAMVPLAALGRVHAGAFSDEEGFTELIEVPSSILRTHPHARATIVEGDCMNRVIPDGNAVVYDPNMEPANGQIAIVETSDHEAIIRQWNKIGNTLVLVADSYAPYEDIVITGDEPIMLIGTVVWHQPPVPLA